MNNYYIIFVFFMLVFTVESSNVCNIKKWWDLGSFDFYPDNMCLNPDKEFEIKVYLMNDICKSNITEYKEIINNDLNEITDYSFLFLYFSDFDLELLSCYNRKKYYMLKTIVDDKLNNILPRINNKLFQSFEFLNFLFDIPILILKCLKSFLMSGVLYICFKKY